MNAGTDAAAGPVGAPGSRGRRAVLVTALLWGAAGFGVHAWTQGLRADRGETAVARLRAFPFGAGRHTRLEASLGSLERTRGPVRFTSEAPFLVVGAVRVEVRFGDTPSATFEVDAVATPLDDAAMALAATLREAAPPATTTAK